MGLESEVNASIEVVEEGETDPGQVEGSGWEQGLLGDVQIPEVPLPVLVAVGIGFITLLLFGECGWRLSAGASSIWPVLGGRDRESAWKTKVAASCGGLGGLIRFKGAGIKVVWVGWWGKVVGRK